MTLLEKAKEGYYPRIAARAKNSVNDETIELALAWARGEIGISQVSRAIDSKTGGGSAAYSILARSLAEHIRRKP